MPPGRQQTQNIEAAVRSEQQHEEDNTRHEFNPNAYMGEYKREKRYVLFDTYVVKLDEPHTSTREGRESLSLSLREREVH